MPSTAEFILNRLIEWGIKRVYGYPGDGVNSLLGAFMRWATGSLSFSAHEEIAAFAVCAHAKFTGEVGVRPRRRDNCILTSDSGPARTGGPGTCGCAGA